MKKQDFKKLKVETSNFRKNLKSYRALIKKYQPKLNKLIDKYTDEEKFLQSKYDMLCEMEYCMNVFIDSTEYVEIDELKDIIIYSKKLEK